ncbi:hypothetical protein FACS189490_11270 [Clostridia bacterium]|nr:hypothetical protein FACS189490_11270 [Clostridia bacterium]
MPFTYEERIYTGKRTAQYSLSLMGREIKLTKSAVPYPVSEKVVTKKTLSFGQNYPLPFSFVTTEFKEYQNVPITRDADEAKRIGAETVSARIAKEFGFSAFLADKSVIFTENKSGVTVSAKITAIEKIGIERELIPQLTP